MTGYKVFTHNWCSPVRGGVPVFDGITPFRLPRVRVDTGPAEYGAGWTFTRELPDAFRLAGLWPTGRPSVAFLVEDNEAIERGTNCRGPAPLVLARVADADVAAAIHALSAAFGSHQSRMAGSQLTWRHALARSAPRSDAIPELLARALASRGLEWSLTRFPTARAAWGAWTTWITKDARAAAAKDDWDACAAWGAWATESVWNAGDGWTEGGEAWNAVGAAWDPSPGFLGVPGGGVAGDAKDALLVEYAALRGWISCRPEMLTTGLRDAYEAGLEIAVPTGPTELGWADE